MFSKNGVDGQRFKVFDDKTFEFYKKFFDRRSAKLKGEELKLSGDIDYYRVETFDNEGFVLWIH